MALSHGVPLRLGKRRSRRRRGGNEEREKEGERDSRP